ncbi:UBP1-associated protein 2B-like isoform X2 [Mangifera indica]|uniref:UBP1-associated protein 2B-like isoform X2 n=1 Tax=Mangifera indica TaxID=29780 RepID=UPI001CF98131|nr:UBP1-associated protein 2B-like isoform X2 [Mangifera indica]
MAKTTKAKKLKPSADTSRKLTEKVLKKDSKSVQRPEKNKPDTGISDSDSEADTDKLTAVLEPYSKEQLINLISSAAVTNSALYHHLQAAADREVTHRKIFVHGLGWDTTPETLKSVFDIFGEIEDLKLVMDRVTGKAKGFAFIVFKTRKSAEKALQNPQKKINNRIVSWQLASVGPTASAAAAAAKEGKEHDNSNTNNNSTSNNSNGIGERKIYVSNVPRDVDKEKLKEFFERFGEIETGPFGFDVNTGKSRGFAIFVYKTAEGLRKALEEPVKVFQGHQLHCQKAAEGKNKNFNKAYSSVQGQQTVQGQQMVQRNHQGQGQGLGQIQDQSQMLAAIAAAQNLALFGQHPGLNPVYGGLFANPGLINPMVAGALNQAVVPSSHVPVGTVGGLGSYGTGQSLQHVYPNAQGKTHGTGGSFPGYTSFYM